MFVSEICIKMSSIIRYTVVLSIELDYSLRILRTMLRRNSNNKKYWIHNSAMIWTRIDERFSYRLVSSLFYVLSSTKTLRSFLEAQCFMALWLFLYHKFQFTSQQISNWWMLVSFQLNYISISCTSFKIVQVERNDFPSLSSYNLLTHAFYQFVFFSFRINFFGELHSARNTVNSTGQNDWMCLIIK